MGDHLEVDQTIEHHSSPPNITSPPQPVAKPEVSPPHLQPAVPLPLLPPSSTPTPVTESSTHSVKSLPSGRSSTRTSNMVQKLSPKQEIDSQTAAAPTCAAGASGPVPKVSAAARWHSEKGTRSRGSKSDRDDWKKLKKIKIDKYDEFNEWVDGDTTMRYRPKDIDARKHLSGWAMRNTNNHNKKVLKKSCLGVFLCSKGCRTSSGEVVTVRPATSDRARKKQGDKKCPRTGCDGKLFHMICAGKSGYPVTHFWRVTDTVIFFQSKGVHDHPRPDVVKTTSQAKMALLEYHRTHRHERPKEICKKVGLHIHKSFNRVDRVARQLREVQNSSDTQDTTADTPKEHYSLRSHIRSLYSNGVQRQADIDNHPFATGQGTFQNAYSSRQSFAGYYPSQSHVDGWTHYAASQDDFTAAFQNYRPVEGQHSSTSYPNQPTVYPYNPSIHSADGTTYDYGYSGNAVLAGPSSSGASKAHDGLEMGGVHTDIQGMPMYHNYPADPSNLLGSNQPVGLDMNHVVYGSSELTSPHQSHTILTPLKQPVISPLKRPAPPDLHSLQESKHPRLSNEPSVDITETSTIKLAEHTPSINIDLSNFSDIFDIPAALGDEGLAGRPKTPVYQALSPAAPVRESDVAGTSGQADDGSLKDEQMCSPSVSPAHSHHPMNVDGGSSVGSPASSVVSQTSNASPSPQLSPSHQPTLTTLSTHAPPSGLTNVPITTAPSGPNDQDGNFLDQLVSMYLGKEEKPISTLKNELQVYADPQSGQRTLAYRPTTDQSHFTPAALEQLRTPGQGSSHHVDGYSWYDRSQSYNAPNGLIPVTEGLISPLITSHFDYTTSITDYYNSQQAAAAAVAAAASGTSETSRSNYQTTIQRATTAPSTGTFGHSSGRYVF